MSVEVAIVRLNSLGAPLIRIFARVLCICRLRVRFCRNRVISSNFVRTTRLKRIEGFVLNAWIRVFWIRWARNVFKGRWAV